MSRSVCTSKTASLSLWVTLSLSKGLCPITLHRMAPSSNIHFTVREILGEQVAKKLA